MKKSCLLLLCLLLVLGACKQKEKELTEESPKMNTEDPIICEELEDAPVSEANSLEKPDSLSAMLKDITSSMDTSSPNILYNHYYNRSIVYNNDSTYRVLSTGIYRRAAGSEDMEPLFQGEMSGFHSLLLYKEFLYFTLNREDADTEAVFVPQTLWQLNLDTLECQRVGDMVENVPYFTSIYDDKLYIGYMSDKTYKYQNLYDVYSLNEQGMPDELLESDFSFLQDMEQEIIPIPICAEMLNGYYLTQGYYNETLSHFYLASFGSQKRQLLFDACEIAAITPSGIYYFGDETERSSFYYYSFSQQESLPILYPNVNYESFHLLTYDRSWIYFFNDGSILRMSRSTGELEVFLETVPENTVLGYCGIDPEYFYVGDTMYPL